MAFVFVGVTVSGISSLGLLRRLFKKFGQGKRSEEQATVLCNTHERARSDLLQNLPVRDRQATLPKTQGFTIDGDSSSGGKEISDEITAVMTLKCFESFPHDDYKLHDCAGYKL